MIDYSLGYDPMSQVSLSRGPTTSICPDSTEDLDWTVSYDVESKPDLLTSIAKLSSAAYYNGANDPVYSIGFKGGAISTKSYYHYNATDDDFTDFIETFKATGSFSVNYDTGAIAASITDGNLQLRPSTT